jgi:hypothetical protein
MFKIQKTRHVHRCNRYPNPGSKYHPPSSVSTQSPRLNLTRTISQHIQSNLLRGFPVIHHLTPSLPRGDICEYNHRDGRVFTGAWLRKHTKSGVNSLPAATQVAVIQLSDADDESRHHGEYDHIAKRGQEAQRNIGTIKLAFQYPIGSQKHIPRGSGDMIG